MKKPHHLDAEPFPLYLSNVIPAGIVEKCSGKIAEVTVVDVPVVVVAIDVAPEATVVVVVEAAAAADDALLKFKGALIGEIGCSTTGCV